MGLSHTGSVLAPPATCCVILAEAPFLSTSEEGTASQIPLQGFDTSVLSKGVA